MTLEEQEKHKIYCREYYQNNKEKIKKKQNEYRKKNNLKIKELSKDYYQNNKEKIKTNSKEYYENNVEIINKGRYKYDKNRKANDNLFKLKTNIRCLVYNTFNRNGYRKQSKTCEILGCSFEEFKIHIESQFEDWMNWDNKGLYNSTPNFGWDIDHIIPISTAKTEEDIIRLNHYTNLQPLCSYINRIIKKDNL